MIDALLAADPAMDAVFVANDQMALGAMHVLSRLHDDERARVVVGFRCGRTRRGLRGEPD